MPKINQTMIRVSTNGSDLMRSFKRFDQWQSTKSAVGYMFKSMEKQLEHQGISDSMDRETSRIAMTGMRVGAPIGTLALSMAHTSVCHAQKIKYQNWMKANITDKGLTTKDIVKDMQDMHIYLEDRSDIPTHITKQGGFKKGDVISNTGGGLTTTVDLSNYTKITVPTANGTKEVQVLNFSKLPKDFSKHGVTIKRNGTAQFEIFNARTDAKDLHRIYSIYGKMVKKDAKQTIKHTRAEMERPNPDMASISEQLKKVNENKKKAKIYKEGAKYLGGMERGAKHMVASPKKWGRQIFRLTSMSVQSSEAMQGVNLAETASMPIPFAAKRVSDISAFVSYKVYKTYKKLKIFKDDPSKLKEIPSKVKAAFSKDHIRTKISDCLKGTQMSKEKVHIFGKNSASKLIRRHVSEKMKSAAISKLSTATFKNDTMTGLAQGSANIMKMNADMLAVGVDKEAVAELTKLTGKELLKNTVGNITIGASKVTVMQVADAVSAPFKTISAPIKFVSKPVVNVAKKVFEVIGNTLHLVLKVFMIAAGVFFLLSVILFFADFITRSFYQSNTRASAAYLGSVKSGGFGAIIEDGAEEAWNRQLTVRGNKIMTALKSSHKDMLDEIEEIRKQYDTTDTQCPSGSLENYKEIFCAVEVMCNFDFDTVTEAELQNWVDALYKQTHIITTEPYEFTYADGSVGQACHIYIDIQYDEILAYEAMAGVTTGSHSGQGTIGGVSCPKGTVVNDDWMNVVRTIKALIAQTHSTYNQSGWVSISVNDTAYSVRTDCSGYVSACLWLNGASAAGTNWNSQSLVNASSIPGFTKYSWSGWDNLQEGDIIAYGHAKMQSDSSGNTWYGWSGHTEIFSHNSGGKHYVYSNGSTNSLNSAVPTVAGNHGYNATNTVVWRPNAPGSTSAGGVSDGTVGGGVSGSVSGGIDVEGAVEVSVDEFDPWRPFYDSSSIVILFSNTSGVSFNEETKNEDGYETALNSTINAEMASSAFFLNEKFDTASNVKCHALNNAEEAYAVSSYDFVRYILAKHGVNTPIDYKSFRYMYPEASPSTLALEAGDIVYYVPKSTKAMDSLELEPREYLDGSKEAEIIESEFVPLICLGDGRLAAYSKDLYQERGAYEASSAQIRTYSLDSLDSLDRMRIVCAFRPNGYVVDSVYGAMGTFSGWTDSNIEALIYLLKGSQWETGYLEYEDILGNTATLDYTPFYSEELFEGNIYISTTEHGNTFKNDVLTVALKYYDQYGILPSVAYSQSFIVSKNRSTEESLMYFNIFEKYTTSINGVTETKYTYTDDGDVIATDYLYEKYGSYLEAYEDLYNTFAAQFPTILFRETFSEQLERYAIYGYLNNDTRSKMRNVYESDGSLAAWDENAVKRKEAIDAAKLKSDALNTAVTEYTSDTREQYYSLNQLIKEAQTSYDDLKNMLESQESATPVTDEILASAESAISAGQELSAAKWQWYENNKTSDTLFVSAYCPGHTRSVTTTVKEKDETTGLEVEKEVTGEESYSHTGPMGSVSEAKDTCSSPVITYQVWIKDACESCSHGSREVTELDSSMHYVKCSDCGEEFTESHGDDCSDCYSD